MTTQAERDVARKEAYLPRLLKLMSDLPDIKPFTGIAHHHGPLTAHILNYILAHGITASRPVMISRWPSGPSGKMILVEALETVEWPKLWIILHRVPGTLTYNNPGSPWTVDISPYIYNQFREKIQPQLPTLRANLAQVLGKDMAGYALAFL